MVNSKEGGDILEEIELVKLTRKKVRVLKKYKKQENTSKKDEYIEKGLPAGFIDIWFDPYNMVWVAKTTKKGIAALKRGGYPKISI